MGTDEKLDAWLAREITVELHEPGPENPHYTALLEEFAMMGEGESLHQAIATLFAKFVAYGESFQERGRPPPPRAPATETRDERADQMHGR